MRLRNYKLFGNRGKKRCLACAYMTRFSHPRAWQEWFLSARVSPKHCRVWPQNQTILKQRLGKQHLKLRVPGGIPVHFLTSHGHHMSCQEIPGCAVALVVPDAKRSKLHCIVNPSIEPSNPVSQILTRVSLVPLGTTWESFLPKMKLVNKKAFNKVLENGFGELKLKDIPVIIQILNLMLKGTINSSLKDFKLVR